MIEIKLGNVTYKYASFGMLSDDWEVFHGAHAGEKAEILFDDNPVPDAPYVDENALNVLRELTIRYLREESKLSDRQMEEREEEWKAQIEQEIDANQDLYDLEMFPRDKLIEKTLERLRVDYPAMVNGDVMIGNTVYYAAEWEGALKVDD